MLRLDLIAPNESEEIASRIQELLLSPWCDRGKRPP
jgi:hypothetical protein